MTHVWPSTHALLLPAGIEVLHPLWLLLGGTSSAPGAAPQPADVIIIPTGLLLLAAASPWLLSGVSRCCQRRGPSPSPSQPTSSQFPPSQPSPKQRRCQTSTPGPGLREYSSNRQHRNTAPRQSWQSTQHADDFPSTHSLLAADLSLLPSSSHSPSELSMHSDTASHCSSWCAADCSTKRAVLRCADLNPGPQQTLGPCQKRPSQIPWAATSMAPSSKSCHQGTHLQQKQQQTGLVSSGRGTRAAAGAVCRLCGGRCPRAAVVKGLPHTALQASASKTSQALLSCCRMPHAACLESSALSGSTLHRLRPALLCCCWWGWCSLLTPAAVCQLTPHATPPACCLSAYLSICLPVCCLPICLPVYLLSACCLSGCLPICCLCSCCLPACCVSACVLPISCLCACCRPRGVQEGQEESRQEAGGGGVAVGGRQHQRQHSRGATAGRVQPGEPGGCQCRGRCGRRRVSGQHWALHHM